MDKDPSYTVHLIGRVVERKRVQWSCKMERIVYLGVKEEKFLIDFQLNCLENKINHIHFN